MAKNPLIRSYPRRANKPLPNKSAGVLDDFPTRRNIATNTGTINQTPVNDSDIANKKYVDDNAFTGTDGSIPFVAAAGTLTEDNANLFWSVGRTQLEINLLKITSDGTQAAPALKFNDTNTGFYKSGDSISLSINNSTVLTIDASGNITLAGTVDGIDIATDVAANTAKATNVSTNLSAGPRTATTMDVDSSDGTDATLVEADTTNAGILGSDKWDEIVANTSKATNVTTNITVVEAPTNVDIQSSDGTNDTIAAADGTNAGVITTTMFDEHVVNTAHAIDNTQAHSDYLKNDAVDVGVGLTLTGDNSSADTNYVPMVLYNTDATPPTASNHPIGTIYLQYTA